MTFTRLGRGHLIAFVAALALLLVMPMTWYTDQQAEQDRQFQQDVVPQLNQQEIPSPSTQAAQAAAAREKSAWRAGGAVDRLLLVTMLAAICAAIAAAFLRAAGRSSMASELASILGLVAAALIIFRIADPPGLHAAAVVKAWAWWGLLCALALAIGARFATRTERRAREPTGGARADASPGAAADVPA